MKTHNWIFVLTLLGCLNNSSFAQKIEWSRTIGSNLHVIGGVNELVDNGFLMGGSFKENAWFGDDTARITLSDSSNEFIPYLAQFDSAWNMVDTHTLRSGGFSYYSTFQWDSLGNVYMSGHFSDSINVSFNGKSPHFLHTKGYRSTYIVKYDTNLNVKWAGVLADTAHNINTVFFRIDQAGNGYLTGYGTAATDINLGDSTQYLASTTNHQYFVAAYSPNGKLKWNNILSLTGFGKVTNITLKNKTLYLIGHFEKTADFDLGTGTKILTSTGSEDPFIATYKADDGSFLDVMTIHGVYDDRIRDVEVDDSGNIYATGFSYVETEFDPKGKGFKRKAKSDYGFDGFLCKYSKNHKLQWAHFVHGTARNASTSGFGIIRKGAHLYWSGAFNVSAIFERDSLVTNQVINSLTRNSFVQYLDTTGKPGWFHTYNATTKNKKADARASFIINQDLYITGTSQDSVNGNNGQLKYRFDHKRKPFNSFYFLMKLSSSAPTIAHVYDTICPGQSYTYPDSMTRKGSNELNFHYVARNGSDSLLSIHVAEKKVNTKFSVTKDSLWALQDNARYLWIDCATDKPVSAADTLRYFLAQQAGNYRLVVNDGVCVDTSFCSLACSHSIIPDIDSLPDVRASCTIAKPKAPTGISTCEGSITATTTTRFPISTQGAHVVTWNYADKEGNTFSQVQHFIIEDSIQPVPFTKSLKTITSNCSIHKIEAPKAVDNCSGILTATSNQVFPIVAHDTTVVTWKFSDGNGNEIAQQQRVVIDSFMGIYQLDTGKSLTIKDSNLQYQWLDCNNSHATIKGANKRRFSPDSSGNYAVVLSSGACVDTMSCKAFVKLITSFSTPQNAFELFPNPYTQFVNLVINQPYQLTIYTVDGKELEKRYLEEPNTYTIDLAPFSNYPVLIFELHNQEVSHIRKVIKL